MREVNLNHYNNHDPPVCDPKCHYCQIRTFKGPHWSRICIINEIDNDVLPENFTFIPESEYGEGITLPDESFFSGCECSSNRQCKYEKCHCLQDMTILEKTGRHGEAYTYSLDSATYILKDAYLESRLPIYECHQACKCDENCPNRVVGRGRELPLKIFKTADGRGWGVRCDYSIKKGQFVDKYVGEVITSEETEIRRKASDIAQKKDVYLFELDKFKGDADRDPSLANTVFVDGEFRSGPTRFINHSCDPNLRIFARVGDHSLKRFHDLAFFAIKDIPAGTELTFDYVDGVDEEKLAIESKDKKKQKQMTKCLCKSKKCRGYLW
ncbi:hypothetical protein G7Y89_g12349 [Cudoniella acicularis]|uniref:Histone-lysine N-methyltransferase n=1 Tax=Cudoniella acicularis TaxID=354080 RepID=A0A8H4VZ94_9HELO|nr:hypothetical protein G7Y89_g12349 [Cudoniella acicularis]